MQERDFAVAAAVIAALDQPAILVGADDRVLALNPPAAATLPALRVGVQIALALRAPDVLDALADSRRAGEPRQIHWRERVPVERVFAVRVAPLDVAPPGVVALTFADLTAERRLEQMRSDFIANASHELRTPLASLLGFIETLQGPARDDAAARARFLTIMHEQARRMARLVDDLLSLSRIEQRLHLRPEAPVDLAMVLREIAAALAPLAQARGVVVDIRADPAIVAGDRDELMRVAENLVENALKYGVREDDPAPRIELSAGRADGEAFLIVRDFGPGVAAEHLPRLTERFYRVDAGKSRAQGGTGLGLALVKHIIARHGGRLAIDSHPGQGATFRVTIPARP
ncbi:MAG: two-component sensor histidine kinase [Methylobacteriaceae bacterium]|nr:two-component sensor histidine kinase [Methylobacteriaceae bacterium]